MFGREQKKRPGLGGFVERGFTSTFQHTGELGTPENDPLFPGMVLQSYGI